MTSSAVSSCSEMKIGKTKIAIEAERELRE
jgi:hypothetical protein